MNIAVLNLNALMMQGYALGANTTQTALALGLQSAPLGPVTSPGVSAETAGPAFVPETNSGLGIRGPAQIPLFLEAPPGFFERPPVLDTAHIDHTVSFIAEPPTAQSFEIYRMHDADDATTNAGNRGVTVLPMPDAVIRTNGNIFPGKSIRHQSSYGPGTKDVQNMARQIEEEGRPTFAYEFGQGNVDYDGHRKDPSLPRPRTFFVSRDGTKRAYRGDGVIPFDREDVEAIEFFNALVVDEDYPGMGPSDAAAKKHGGSDDTLGTHGHGTTITLTYLRHLGLEVEIESTVRVGDKVWDWKARAELEMADDERNTTMHVVGTWVGKSQAPQTVIRIKRPQTEGANEAFAMLFDRMQTVQNFFLYYNPNFPAESLLVDPNPNAPELILQQTIGDGRVMVIDGIVDWDPQEDGRTLFVDGVKLHTEGYYSLLFPWSFEGYGQLKRQHAFFLKRDSETDHILGQPDQLIRTAIYHSQNRQFLGRLIDAAVSWKGGAYDPLPLEFRKADSYGVPEELKKLDENTAGLLREIWNERHGQAAITANKDDIEKYQDRAQDLKIIFVPAGIYELLKEAGITDVQMALGITAKPLTARPISVPYATEKNVADRLQRLAKEAAQALAKFGSQEGQDSVRVLTQRSETTGQEVKVLQVVFPFALTNQDDVDARETRDAVDWIRAAAVVSHTSGMNFSVRSCIGSRRSGLSIRVEKTWGGSEDTYNTGIELETVEGTQEVAEPFTAITFSGEVLNELSPPPGMAENFRNEVDRVRAEILKDLVRRAAELPQVPKEIADLRQEAGRRMRKANDEERRVQEEERRSRERIVWEARESQARIEELEAQSRARIEEEQRRLDAVERKRLKAQNVLKSIDRQKRRALFGFGAVVLALGGFSALFKYGSPESLEGILPPEVYAKLLGWDLLPLRPVTISASNLGAVSGEFQFGQAVDRVSAMGVHRVSDGYDVTMGKVGLPMTEGGLPRFAVRFEQTQRITSGGNQPTQPRRNTAHGSTSRAQSQWKPVALPGYRRLSTHSRLVITPTGRAGWEAFLREEFQFFAVFNGFPADYTSLLRQPVSPEESYITIREGEEVLAISDLYGNPIAGVELFRHPLTGDVIIKSDHSEDVVIFFAPISGDHFNPTQPTELDLENYVELNDLDARWRAIYEALDKNSSLTPRQRAAIILYEWGRHAQYLDDPDLDGQVLGYSVKDIAASVLNTRGGICNTIDGGLAIAMRRAGVPTRHYRGIIIDHNHRIGTHGYDGIWLGKDWVPVEPQQDYFSLAHLVNLEGGIDLDHLRVTPLQQVYRSDLRAIGSMLIESEREAVAKFFDNLTVEPVVVPAFGAQARRPVMGKHDIARAALFIGGGLAIGASASGVAAFARRWSRRTAEAKAGVEHED